MKVRLGNRNGKRVILINEECYSPLAFRSFRPDEKNISQFYKAGVRLMCIQSTGIECTLEVPYSLFGESWIDDETYNFDVIDTQIELFIKNAPDAYFNIMLLLDTRSWYLEKYPHTHNTFWELVETAGDEKWRNLAAKYLTAAVEHIETKYSDKVFAYTLMCGTATEWYTHNKWGENFKLDNSNSKINMFAKYAKGAEIPKTQELSETSADIFRHPKLDKNSLDYWKFHSNLIADTILFFAEKLQAVVKHNKLVGLFYGYIMLKEARMLCQGHIAYEKVWKSDNIDMIYAPAEYSGARGFEGTSAFLATVDSLNINSKLYIHEIDHRTYLASTLVDGKVIPDVLVSPLKDEFQSVNVLKREFSMCLAKRCGLWWFDFFGGYYDSDGLRECIQKMVKITKKLENVEMHSISEIAVFADSESLYYLSQHSGMNSRLLAGNRDALNRIGAPYDIFNLSDIEKVDLSQYKLFVFLNAFKISRKTSEYINKTIKNNNRTLLWLYAPNIIEENDVNYNNIEAVTNIKIEKCGYESGGAAKFKIADEKASVIEGSNIAYRRFLNFTIAYSSDGVISHEHYRSILKIAGVHIYNSDGIALFANSRLLAVHSPKGGVVRIAFPSEKTLSVQELFEEKHIICENGMLQADTQSGAAKLFLIENNSKAGN